MTTHFDWLKFGARLGALAFCAAAWGIAIATMGHRVTALVERMLG